MPGADQAIEAAAKTGSFVNVLFVALVVAGFVILGVIIRWQMGKIDGLQSFVQNKLVDLLESSNEANRELVVVVKQLSQRLDQRICLLPDYAQHAAMEALRKGES